MSESMTREERLELLYEPCSSKADLKNHIKYFLNIDLPDDTVDEQSNSNPMDFVWEMYYAMLTGTGPTRVVVAASRNTAKCLAEGTMVATPKGPVEIQRLKPGDLVFDEYGKPIKVVALHDQGEQECVDLWNGKIKLATCTPNHVWSMSEDRKPDIFMDKKVQDVGSNWRIKKVQFDLNLGDKNEPLVISRTGFRVSPSGKHHCWDITVDSEKSLYCLQNGLVTHNTLTACIIRFYGMIHFRRSGTHLAAIQTQSDSATSYLNKMLHIDGVKEFIETDNTRHKRLSNLPINSYTSNRECELKVAVATLSGVNSARGSLNIKDEVDLIPPQILTEASFISDPTRDEHQFDPIEIYLSSRKSNSGPIQKMLDEADTGENQRLAVYKWSWVDWMRRCSPAVALTDQPKTAWMHTETLQVVWDERALANTSESERQLFHEIRAFEGCQTCPAFIACQGRATNQRSTTKMLRNVSFIADRLKDASDAAAIIAQGLNWKPESSAVVFRMFNRRFHFLKPIEFYRWCVGSYFVPTNLTTDEVSYILENKDPADLILITPTKTDIYNALRQAGWRIHYGIDWGSIDPAVCVVVGYHRQSRRMVVLHTTAMTGYPNEDWAKYIHKTVWDQLPCDLVCPDMADINSPIYFGRLIPPMPCHDKKPSKIEPGVSQIRSFLWNPATQSSHFAMLNDGDLGMNKWVSECFEKWTYKKTVTGYDFKHFEDNEYTHPLDSIRYAADPWIADMKIAFSVTQPRSESTIEVASRMGDKEAMEIRKQKEELKQQIADYFNNEHGVENLFLTPEQEQKLYSDRKRGWDIINPNPDRFVPKEKDPNESEPLPTKPKSRVIFRF